MIRARKGAVREGQQRNICDMEVNGRKLGVDGLQPDAGLGGRGRGKSGVE